MNDDDDDDSGWPEIVFAIAGLIAVCFLMWVWK